jgi:MFS family permease
MQARKETSLVQLGRRYVLGTVTMIVGAFLLITVPIHHQRSHEDWWILALSFFLLFSGSLVSSLVKRAIRSGIRESRWPESALDRMSRWAYALQPASFALSALLVGLVALIWVMPKQWPGTR